MLELIERHTIQLLSRDAVVGHLRIIAIANRIGNFLHQFMRGKQVVAALDISPASDRIRNEAVQPFIVILTACQ